jgi:hypothetical protein
MVSDAERNGTEAHKLHGQTLRSDASVSASGQPVAVDQIEPGDRIWCPVDVDLADSPQPAEVDFWDYLSAPPASPPRTASGRLKGRISSTKA